MGAWTLLRFWLEVAPALGKTAAGVCLVGDALWFPRPRRPPWRDNVQSENGAARRQAGKGSRRASSCMAVALWL